MTVLAESMALRGHTFDANQMAFRGLVPGALTVGGLGSAAIVAMALFSADIHREAEVGDAQLSLSKQGAALTSEQSSAEVSEEKQGSAEVSATAVGSAEITVEVPEDG